MQIRHRNQSPHHQQQQTNTSMSVSNEEDLSSVRTQQHRGDDENNTNNDIDTNNDIQQEDHHHQHHQHLEEDFILTGYNIQADPNPNCFLKFLFDLFPEFIGDLLSAFGVAPVVTLVMVYFLVKGVAVTAFNMNALPLFKDGLNVTDGATFQRISTITGLSWPLKPVIGLLSDTFPIFAFRKRYYLTGAAVASISILLGISSFAQQHNSASSNTNNENHASSSSSAIWITATLMFCANLCFATIDLLCEAVYSRFYVLRPKNGTAIVSLVWGLVMISGVPGSFFVGPLADAHRPFLALLIIALLVACCVIPFYRNWLGEKPVSRYRGGFQKIESNTNQDQVQIAADDDSTTIVTSSGKQQDNSENQQEDHDDDETEMQSVNNDESEDETTQNDSSLEEPKQPELSKVGEQNLRYQGIAMGIICPLTACSAMVLEIIHRHQEESSDESSSSSSSSSSSLAFKKLIVPLCSACLLISLARKWLPWKIFKAMTYMFLKEALYVSTAGALDYFYLADEKCVPGGPHFSYTYYQTITAAVGSLFGAVGSVLFQKYFSKMNFQRIFWTTTTMRIIASLFDVILVERWNVSILGIKDEHFYLFGDAIIYPISYTLDFMPAVMLTAQLCPHGHEATMYAVLAGFSNFGQSTSGFFGAFLTDMFGIRTSSLKMRNTTTSAAATFINGTLIPSSPSSFSSSCDFSNLSLLIIVAHAVFPALTLPLVSYLVPNTTAESQEQQRKSDKEEEGKK